MKKPMINKAYYTILLNDALIGWQGVDTTLEEISTDFDNYTTASGYYEPGEVSLHDMIIAKFGYYEINDYDKDARLDEKKFEVFLNCIKYVYKSKKSKYIEMFDTLYRNYDYETGLQRKTVRTDSSSYSDTNDDKSGGESQNTEFSLPNKKVTPTDNDGYATGKEKGDSTGWSYRENTGSKSYGSTITTDRKDMYLTLRKQYLAQIHNVMEEFADEFKECFIMIYS